MDHLRTKTITSSCICRCSRPTVLCSDSNNLLPRPKKAQTRPGSQIGCCGPETAASISHLLHGINLQQYIEAFEEAKIMEITENSLEDIDDEILQSIGVNSPIHRLKIRVQMQKISSHTLQDPPPSIETVTEFLANSDMTEHCSKFEEHQINGETLLEATDEVLKEIGIDKAIDRAVILVGFRKLAHGPTELSSKYPVEKIVKLISDPSLRFNRADVDRYCEIVQRYGIDGEILDAASLELAGELKMPPLHLRKIKKKLT